MNFGRAISALFTAGLAFLLIGCDSITNTLELIVDTTSAVVDIATPQYAALLNPYFTAVSNFVDQASTELASTDSEATKAAVIAQDAAAIAAPDLSGVAGTIVTRVSAIAPLIAKLVNEIQSASATIDSTPGGANAFFAAHKSYKPPTAKQLAKVLAKNAELKAKLSKK